MSKKKGKKHTGLMLMAIAQQRIGAGNNRQIINSSFTTVS
jgi:hypothetical protein